MIILGYSSIDKMINKFDIDNNYKKKYFQIIQSFPKREDLPKSIIYNKLFVNESGLYNVLTKSNKPIAKLFKDKYYKDIMYQIRKSGKYISNKNEMNQIKKLNDKISNYKTELNYYDNKCKFEPSINGYIYICEDNQIKNGIKIKCYKA